LSTASEESGIEGAARSVLNKEKKPWRFTIPPEVVDRIPEMDENFIEYDEWEPETQRLPQLTAQERELLTRDGAHHAGPDSWDVLLNN
jgi:hypothetical protein